MTKISKIFGREILDSRGNPTVKAVVVLDNGIAVDAAVPSGASTGIHEALELRDCDPKRYGGMGVLKAIDNIQNRISPKLKGMDPTRQREIDEAMLNLDGTSNKEKLGANSILAVSLACARTASVANKIWLYEYIHKLYDSTSVYKVPTPMFNVVNGGLHGSNDSLTIQEFLLIPNSNLSYPQQVRVGVEVYQRLKKHIRDDLKLSTGIGDEGGFTPAFTSNEQVIKTMITAIQQAGYSYKSDVAIGLDIAASTYYQNGKYSDLSLTTSKVSPEAYSQQVKILQETYGLVTLEDPLSEDDWENWKLLTSEIGEKATIIGDDLLCTNPKRLKKAIEQKSCNAILVKVNQIGTLSETLDVIKIARQANFKIVISHRSGETVDDFIADLAVAVSSEYAKMGAPCRGERVVKYNRLSEIYEHLGD